LKTSSTPSWLHARHAGHRPARSRAGRRCRCRPYRADEMAGTDREPMPDRRSYEPGRPEESGCSPTLLRRALLSVPRKAPMRRLVRMANPSCDMLLEEVGDRIDTARVMRVAHDLNVGMRRIGELLVD